jgi:integrase
MDLSPDELALLERLRDDPAKLAAATRALQPPRKGKRNQRAKGEGSVYRVSVGGHTYWRGQVEAGHYPSGKRRYATITRKTKKAVIDALPELRRRVGAGVVGPDQTVAQLIDEYLNVRDGKVSPGTLAEYRRRFDLWVIPHVGNVRLRKLTATHVRAMVAALEGDRPMSRPLSARTVNLAKSALSSALSWAVTEGKIERNVCERVPGAKLGARLDDALSPDETDCVLAVARDDRLYALLYLSATLGIRQGEALSLRWADVDLDKGKHGELRIDQSKTRAGERSLPLVASCRETLREHRTRQVAERMAAGRWNDNDLVFPDEHGDRITSRDVLRWWHSVLAKAGLERRRWHALRHSAAQRMLARGVPLDLVSITLGHSGIAVTSDVYGRSGKDAVRRELGRYLDAETS